MMLRTSLILTLMSVWTFAQNLDSLKLVQEKLEKDIQFLESEIIENNKLMKDEAQRFAQLETQLEKAVDSRRTDLKKLLDDIKKIEEQSRREKRQQAGYDANIKNQEIYFERLNKIVLGKLDVLEAYIQASVPFEKDQRLSRVQGIKNDLKIGAANAEEAFTRMQLAIDEEIKFGDKVDLKNTSVTRKDGSVINVKMLKLGNQAMFYGDDEGKYYGILKREKVSAGYKYSWIEDVNFKQREQIRLALDVKEAKKAPQLVVLPVYLSVDQEASEK